MLPQNPQPNNSPTLRFDSEGYVQIVLPPRPVPPASATLVYVSTRMGDVHLVVLRLSLPGRRLYLIANPSLPPHHAALKRLAGQSVVRVVDTTAGIPLAVIFQPSGARNHLYRLINGIPATECPYNAQEWAGFVSDTQRNLPAAAEIPAVLEGYQPG